MNAKIIKVASNDVDYTTIAKKYDLAINVVVPTRIVEVEIVDWPGILISAVRYVLLKCLPTVRLEVDNIGIETNDMNLISERLIHSLKAVAISSDIKATSFNIDVVNTNANSYIMIDTHNINSGTSITTNSHSNTGKATKSHSIAEYVNRMDVCALGIGCYLKVNGDIRRISAIDANDIHYNSTTLTFSRTLTEHLDASGFKLNSGKFGFVYQDTIDAKDMLKAAFEYLVELFATLSNVEDHMIIEVNKHALIIPLDRSCIIANLIYQYLDVQYSAKGIKGLTCCLREYTEYSSLLIFDEIGDLHNMLRFTLGLLRDMISNMMTKLQ